MNFDSPKAKIGIGIFFVVGAIVTVILKMNGIGPPTSNTPYSQGSQMGFYIGSAVGATIGLMLILKGNRELVQSKKETE